MTPSDPVTVNRRFYLRQCIWYLSYGYPKTAFLFMKMALRGHS